MNADEDLRAQLAAVTEELGAVRAQLDALTTARGLTMAGQVRCPGCGGRKLLHVTKVLDRANGGSKTRRTADRSGQAARRDRAPGRHTAQAYPERRCPGEQTSRPAPLVPREDIAKISVY